MANYCHQCAQPVGPGMQACPRCGARLVAVLDRAQRGVELAVAPPHSMVADQWRPLATAQRYAKAPNGLRVQAYFIDCLVGLAMLLPGLIVLMIAAGMDAEALAGVGGVTTALGALYAAWYALTRDGGPGGAGIGKRRMGLMVVHLPSDRPASRGQSAMRTVVMWGLGAVPVVGPFIEPIIGLSAADGRRLGDRAADTQVVTAAEYASRV